VADYQTKNAEATVEEETHFPNLKKFGEFAKIFSTPVDLNPYYQLVLQVRINYFCMTMGVYRGGQEGALSPPPSPPCLAKIVCILTFLKENSMF